MHSSHTWAAHFFAFVYFRSLIKTFLCSFFWYPTWRQVRENEQEAGDEVEKIFSGAQMKSLKERKVEKDIFGWNE